MASHSEIRAHAPAIPSNGDEELTRSIWVERDSS
jgi:hypothetical protein